MIVPGMTLSEINSAIMKDYEAELRAKFNAIKVTYRRKWQLNGNRDYIESTSFQAKSKNTWRIIIHCKQYYVSVLPYIITYDHVGITASHLTVNNEFLSTMYFNTHFFKRYKERAKIDIAKPEDLVKYFFRKNMPMVPVIWDFEDGRLQLFTPLKVGIGLGNHHMEEKIYEFKTFVDDSLLKDEQKARILKTHLQIMEETEALRRSKNR